ncbi:MAG: hypothetical protein LAT68_04840 [Cyclobacteriaceae bacterium]|nr:hypothetical protein [Cyclobacteriaceae bacterium]MCH8515638.1 hypothetical protein [Cyclobacteriaceae bacterium]
MSKEELKLEISALTRKLEFLLSNYEDSQREVKRLTSENKELKSLLTDKEKVINQYKEKVHIHEISGRLSGIDRTDDTQSEELKSQIDDYIKELDKCIAQLSGQ